MMRNTLLYPIATEKAVNMIERDNIIVYVVDMRSTKQQVKKEFEDQFRVKVSRVNMANASALTSASSGSPGR